MLIAGAGMAGLCAAARAREQGARPTLLEKGTRPGGSMLLSSCVIWRFPSFADFRRECPLGDLALQRNVFERVDEGIAWLESLGAPVVDRGVNDETVYVRFDPRGLTDALVRAAGEPRLRTPLEESVDHDPLILATGGFQGDRALVARHITPEAAHVWLRANPWSAGDGLRSGLARGSATTAGLDEFFGRNLPAPPAEVAPETFVSTAQLYADASVVVNDEGAEFAREPYSWSQNDVAQATSRQPRASAWYVLDARGLSADVRAGSVAAMVSAADRAGGTVLRAPTLRELAASMGVDALPASPRLVEPPFTAVHVAAGITHTIGGLRIDDRARVLRQDGSPIPGLFACGADAGGIATGGYASGLAAALVFGLIAAENAIS